jgi:sugar/nucleoside kinase (ribokinase family)
MMAAMFDICYIGHYTKDTIVYPHSTLTHDGGAFFFGLNVVARMGMRGAVITNLARQDWHVVDELEKLGVTVFARESKHSTCLRLIYPTSNLDERTIELTSQADPFTVEQIQNIDARAFIVGASVRGEAPTAVVEALAAKGKILTLDVQGFLRIVKEGALTSDGWQDRASILKHVTILKTDAVEAKLLTGEDDRQLAAKKLAAYGPREVLMTHNGGVLVYYNGEFFEAPLVPKELRGRSGRGDTCTASYVSRRFTSPPEDAVTWAAAVTSLKLENEGPFRRDITEAQALYARLKMQSRKF